MPTWVSRVGAVAARGNGRGGESKLSQSTKPPDGRARSTSPAQHQCQLPSRNGIPAVRATRTPPLRCGARDWAGTKPASPAPPAAGRGRRAANGGLGVKRGEGRKAYLGIDQVGASLVQLSGPTCIARHHAGSLQEIMRQRLAGLPPSRARVSAEDLHRLVGVADMANARQALHRLVPFRRKLAQQPLGRLQRLAAFRRQPRHDRLHPIGLAADCKDRQRSGGADMFGVKPGDLLDARRGDSLWPRVDGL